MNFINRSAGKTSIARKILVLVTSSVLLGGIPLVLPATVYAQTAQLNLGKSIRATSAQDETLYLNNDRTYSYNLNVSEDMTVGNLNIPAGATIQGRFEPADGGLRYVANAVEFNSRTYRINATSDVIEDVKDPRDTSARAIAEDAAIGAVGGAVIGEVLGGIDAEEVIGGAIAGGVVGNTTADRVVVIEPDEQITLYSR